MSKPPYDAGGEPVLDFTVTQFAVIVAVVGVVALLVT